MTPSLSFSSMPSPILSLSFLSLLPPSLPPDNRDYLPFSFRIPMSSSFHFGKRLDLLLVMRKLRHSLTLQSIPSSLQKTKRTAKNPSPLQLSPQNSLIPAIINFLIRFVDWLKVVTEPMTEVFF